MLQCGKQKPSWDPLSRGQEAEHSGIQGQGTVQEKNLLKKRTSEVSDGYSQVFSLVWILSV